MQLDPLKVRKWAAHDASGTETAYARGREANPPEKAGHVDS